MEDLLTTRQLQELLQVDRITIYRMLADGRLRGFKVGGQWRFSQRDIERWLQEQQLEQDPAPRATTRPVAPPLFEHNLPLACSQGILSIYAEALDIGAVLTGADGLPLAEVVHSCSFCRMVLSTDEGQRRCAASWQASILGRTSWCHAGLACRSRAVAMPGEVPAYVSCCQFLVNPTRDAREWRASLPALAAELGLPEAELLKASQAVQIVPEVRLGHVEQLLARVAETVAEISAERARLFDRLQQIATMARSLD